MNYVAFNFKVTPVPLGNEILMAYLSLWDFESFVPHNSGFTAYINEPQFTAEFQAQLNREISGWKFPDIQFSYTTEKIPAKNWNANWEQNFTPIEVSNQCRVRAPFHPQKNVDFELVISPKMAFGTGHHQTTYLMLKAMLALSFTNKKVLDMGCGTAVLAILAHLKKAKEVLAIDIDSWAVENAKENCELNNATSIAVQQGDASILGNTKYDIILANINRNILLKDIEVYSKVLVNEGLLLLSGFYLEDLPLIEQEAAKHCLQLTIHTNKDSWVMASFKKQVYGN